MSTLRHRLSSLMGFSEDSKAESQASTRALRSLSDSSYTDSDIGSGWSARKDSTFSRDSGYHSVATSTESASSLEPASPGRLKKAASTTFHAFSKSLRSKTKLFYSDRYIVEAARPATPQPPSTGVPGKNRDSATLWFSTRKRMGQSPRSTHMDDFHSPRRSKSRDSVIPTTDPNNGSPRSTNRHTSLWSSIKERANRNPRSTREEFRGDEDSPACPQSPIDDFAPSLNVDIPDSDLTLYQLLHRSKSRSRGASSFSQGRGATNFSNMAKDESKRTTSGSVCERTSAEKTLGYPISQPGVRFLELTPPRIALHQSPLQKRRSRRTAQSVGDYIGYAGVDTAHRNGEPDELLTTARPPISPITSIKNGLNDLDVTGTESDDYKPMPDRSEESTKSFANESRFVDQDILKDSPDPPSMGSRAVWNQARADRDSRYFALKVLTADVDSESDSDTELARQSGMMAGRRRSNCSATKHETAIRPSCSNRGDFQYAVEAIERLPGKAFDDSNSSEARKPSERVESNSDLHYAVESIERSLVTPSSSSNHFPEEVVPQSLSSNLIVKDIKNPPIVELEQQRLDVADAPGEINQSASEGPFARLLQNGKTSLAEADYSARCERFSSTDSISTTESCAVTTHDPLCYTPPPYPNLHVRSSPVARPMGADEVSDAHRFGADDFVVYHYEPSKNGLDPHTPALDQSPWLELLFDSGTNMKLTMEPLTSGKCRASNADDAELKLTKERLAPDKPHTPIPEPADVPLPETPLPVSLPLDLPRTSDAVDAELKLTNEPLTLSKPHMPIPEPADVPLPEPPFQVSCPFDLSVRLKIDQSLAEGADVPKGNQDTAKLPEQTDLAEAPSRDAKPAATDEPSSPSKCKEKASRRKKSLKKRLLAAKDTHILEEASGNSEKRYSWSQIVKGDRQVDTLRESIGEVTSGSESMQGPNLKDDEIIRSDRKSMGDREIVAPTENEDYPTDNRKKAVSWAKEDEIIGCADPLSPALKRKRGSIAMGELLTNANTESSGLTPADLGIHRNAQPSTLCKDTESWAEIKPWDDEGKAAVVKHLMSVVYDIEREANKESELEQGSDE